MAKVIWSREARDWLQEIHAYIAQDNPSAADRTVAGIAAKAEALSRFPELGHRYTKRSERNVRIVLYGHYRIAYEVAAGEEIRILGVFHGALDIRRFLG